jgi:hypothetical protein
MDDLNKLNLRLIECYRGSSNKDEAEENCKKHLDDIKELFADNTLAPHNVLINMWKEYHSNNKYINKILN